MSRDENIQIRSTEESEMREDMRQKRFNKVRQDWKRSEEEREGWMR